MVERARELRRAATPAELALWPRLRDRRFLGCKFVRQRPIGLYVADFYCSELALVLELDGQIHDELERRALDALRTEALEGLGLLVVRVPNVAVLTNIERVLDLLARVAIPRLPEAQRLKVRVVCDGPASRPSAQGLQLMPEAESAETAVIESSPPLRCESASTGEGAGG